MQPQLLQALELYEELAGPQKYRKVHTPFVSDERLEDLVGKSSGEEKPSVLGHIALRLVMKILYAARNGRPDLLRPTTELAKNGYEVGPSL